MRRLILVILMACGLSHANMAAAPTWSVNPSDFSNSMLMVGVLKIDKVESLDENDMIAAFVNGEVRGVANLQYESVADRYFAYLIIYGNSDSSDVSFKLYDADNDTEYQASNSTNFIINGLVGDISNPYFWSDVALNTEAEILSFDFNESTGDAVINENSISIPVEPTSDLSTLIADFEISMGASVKIGGIDQVSGQTINNFIHPVTYQVVSEDGQSMRSYAVTLITSNEPPTDINLSTTVIDENNPVNETIAVLEVVDDDSNHTFSFVTGDGDDDNELFEIVSGEIRALASFDFESKNSLSIRIMVTDGIGQSIEKSLLIEVNDLNESPTDILLNNSSINENVNQGGIIGSLSGKDPDLSSTLSFSLPDEEDNALFTITNDNLLSSTVSFDFEEQSVYIITVQVEDNDGLTFKRSFEIFANDQNETPKVINPIGTISVMDDQSIELSYENVFLDVDQGDELTVSATSANISNILIDEMAQTVTISDLSNAGQYQLELMATDLQGLSVTDVIQIDVNFITSINDPPHKLEIFPNPAQYELNLMVDPVSSINLQSARILDLSGKNHTTQISIRNNTFDVSRLKQGVYILELIENSRMIHLKFIKE